MEWSGCSEGEPIPSRALILGTRGIPGAHGGFESFAEDLAGFLRDRGWAVTVYCQGEPGSAATVYQWNDIRLVRIPTPFRGAIGTIVFDWRCLRHASREEGLPLVLGYNTALFTLLLRLRGRPVVMNMDGFEWRRRKYNLIQRLWLYLNEWAGCWTATHLVADHPEIARHLEARVSSGRITMIPYGARSVPRADPAVLHELGLQPRHYALLIARPEPENSVLETVRAFSSVGRPIPLVVLGRYDRHVRYQRKVLDAAGPEVRFLGAIYERATVDALRRHASFYVHGHTVGGTNPALVEALGAGVPVLAHDNVFNRWVAGQAAVYFTDEEECGRALDRLTDVRHDDLLREMQAASRARHAEEFGLTMNLERYERMLLAQASPREARTKPLPSPVVAT